jgi:hypothetical protein
MKKPPAAELEKPRQQLAVPPVVQNRLFHFHLVV